MQTLIVTGGAGFIGCNFVRLARARGAGHVIVVDKLTYAGHRANLAEVLADGRVELVEADIADSAAMAALFARHRPDAIVNFAAETHVDRSIDDAAAFIQTNLVGVYVLLETARRYCSETGAGDEFRFLHVSTYEVYGSLCSSGLFA